jgi:hypothetical protein
MPVKKTQLSRAQRDRYLEQAQELRAAGLECEIPSEWEENSRSLDIVVAPPEGNILCELSSGITACAIGVRIVALTSNLILEDFTIASKWDPELVAVCSNPKGLYVVGAAINFTESESLNRRIEDGLHFHRRGDTANGWVIASGFKPIPDKYGQRMTTDLRLTFTDQFGHDHSAQAQAFLERSARLKASDIRARKSPSLWPAEGLPGRKDPGREVGVPTPKPVYGDVDGHPSHRGQS